MSWSTYKITDVGGSLERANAQPQLANGTSFAIADTIAVDPSYYDMGSTIVEMWSYTEFGSTGNTNSIIFYKQTDSPSYSYTPSSDVYADVYRFGDANLGTSPGIYGIRTKSQRGVFAFHNVDNSYYHRFVLNQGYSGSTQNFRAVYGFNNIPVYDPTGTSPAPGMGAYNAWAMHDGYGSTTYYSTTANANNKFYYIRKPVISGHTYTIDCFVYSEYNYDGIMISSQPISSNSSYSGFSTSTTGYITKLCGESSSIPTNYSSTTYKATSNGYIYIYYRTDNSTLKYAGSYSLGDVSIHDDSAGTPSSNVILNKNAGSGGTSSFTTQWGSIVSVGTVPTRSGYGGNSFTFLGYYDRPTCTRGNFTGIQYINASGNSNGREWNRYGIVTLYAGWRNNVTYTLYSNPVQIYASEKNPTVTTLDRSVTFNLGQIYTSSGESAVDFTSSLGKGITATMDPLVNHNNVVKVTIPSGTTASNYVVIPTNGYMFAFAPEKTTITSDTYPNTYVSNISGGSTSFPSWTLNIVQNTVQSIRLYLGKSSIEIGEKTNIMPEAKLASEYVVNLMGASGVHTPTYTQSNSSNIISTTEMHLSRHLVIYVDDFTYSDATDSAALISQADADTQMYAEDAGFSTWEEYIAAYVKDPMSFSSNKYVYTGTMDMDLDGSTETYYIWECVSENANNCWCSYLITDTIDISVLKNSSLEVNTDYSRFLVSNKHFRHIVGYLDRDMMNYKLFNKFEWIVRVDEFSEA